MTNKNKIGWGILAIMAYMWGWNTYLDVSLAFREHYGKEHFAEYGGSVCKSLTDSVHWISIESRMSAGVFFLSLVVLLVLLALFLIQDKPKYKQIPDATATEVE